MAFTHVRTVTKTWVLNGTSPSITVPSTGAGNLLVMFVCSPDDAETSVTFPSGWATPIVALNFTTSVVASYYVNNPGGITSIQVNNVVNTTYTHAIFMEFSSTGNDAAFDSDNDGGGLATITAVSTTMSGSSGLVIGVTGVQQYQEAGTPTYDSGYTGLFLQSNFTGTTYAEYNTAATSASIDITPGAGIGSNTHWETLVLAFKEPTPSGALRTTLSPSTSLAATAAVHSAEMQTAVTPSTQAASAGSNVRALLSNVPEKIRLEAGGYSPRTIPLTANIGPRTITIVMAAAVDFVTPTRTIPLAAALQSSTTANQRTIPLSWASVYHVIPVQAALRLTSQRTVPTAVVTQVTHRTVPLHGLFGTLTLGRHTLPVTAQLAKLVSYERTVLLAALFARLARVLPTKAALGTLLLTARTVPAEAVLATTQANVRRSIALAAVLVRTEANVQRTVPMQATFIAGFKRTVPLGVMLNGLRRIPMTAQTPLVGTRVIHLAVKTLNTYERLVRLAVTAGETDEARTVAMAALFGISAGRTIPAQATLNYIITYQRMVPETAALQATDTRTIRQRALLGGPTKSWVLCKPATGVKVCAQLAIV